MPAGGVPARRKGMKKILILMLAMMLMIMPISLLSCEDEKNDDDYSTSVYDPIGSGYWDDYESSDDYYDDYESSSDYWDDESSEESSRVAIKSVTLSESKVTLKVGEYITLYANVTPSNASVDDLTWNAYGDAIELDYDYPGRAVLAVEAGTAYVSVMAPNGSFAKCNIIVVEEEEDDNTGNEPDDDTGNDSGTQEVLANSISLNLTSKTLSKGDSVNLVATILPSNTTNKTVTWSSSNTAVAIVADGTVAAIGNGTTIISAKTSNGKVATCVITVQDAQTPSNPSTPTTPSQPDTSTDFEFEAYGSGYTVVAYTGTATNVTVPSTYNGKKVIAIGTEDGNKGFYKNYDIVSVVLPDTIKEINKGAFSYCGSLESITIPNSVTTIISGAFSNTTSIKNATIPTTAISYTPKDSLQTVVINGGTSIGYGAFSGCTSLTSVTIPNSVTSIEISAFKNCSSLTSITIPNSVTSIGDHAFYGCTLLRSITIGNSVASIGSWAFYSCSSLTSIEIPNSVTSIGNSAFRNCSSFTSITIPDSVTSIGESVFYDCTSLTSAKGPAMALKTGAWAPFCGTPLQTVIITSGSTIENHAFISCASLESITIPVSVTSIGDYAFSDCTNIKNATIPTTAISYIPKDSLQTVVINGGTSIGNSAFENCSSLTSITIGNSVTYIGTHAFYGCNSLTSAIFEEPSDWWVTPYSDQPLRGEHIETFELEDKSTAADLLKSIYLVYWVCN